MVELSFIEQALRDGHNLHAFRSGGGLRVVYVRKPAPACPETAEIGYGEHPYVEEALRHCGEDIQAGHRDYKAVYGGKYDHYLTGSASPSSELDRWLLNGHSFDIRFQGGQFVFEGGYLYQRRLPKEVEAQLKALGRRREQYRRRRNRATSWRKANKYAAKFIELLGSQTVRARVDGVEIEAQRYRFPGGQMGYSWQVVHKTNGADDYMPRRRLTVKQSTLSSLLQELEIRIAALRRKLG